MVRLVRRGRHHSSGEMRRHVKDSKSVSDAFDQLMTLTNGGMERAELAPFGPKLMSVAICIFSVLTDSPVFYTQPTAYHPDYSLGVSKIAGKREIYAHCIRLGGKDLYRLPE